MRLPLLALLFFTVPLSAEEAGLGLPTAQAPSNAEAIALPFYDGIVAAVERDESGAFRGVLTRTFDDGSTTLLARYHLLPEARQGLLIVPGRGVTRTLDYSGFRPPRGENLETFLAGHTSASVALSMLVLWEDEEAAAGLLGLELAPGLDGLQDPLSSSIFWRQDEEEVEICPGCTARLNGCSGWLTPQYCAGSHIQQACLDHDACYQCGAACRGATRADCDNALRQDIYNMTGSSWCANVYYWGVRIGGWPFYVDPDARYPMHPDVYSLGIEISACEGEYAHLCTRYVM